MDKQKEEPQEDPTFETRHALNGINIRYLVAMQVKAMRVSRGWSPWELAEKAGLKVTDITGMENPKGGNPSLSKLKEVAKACDVALLVRFTPWRVGPSTLSPQGFDKEVTPQQT